MITILHRTQNRIRLQTKDINTLKRLIIHFRDSEDVTLDRINWKIKSAVLGYKDSNTYTKNIKPYIDSGKPEKSKKLKHLHTHRNASLLPLIVSAGSLALSFFLPMHLRKFISWVSAIPILGNGVKEFTNHGLNAHFMESTAVFISLFRQDYFTAGITSTLLETSEYLEETLHRKSESMLKELIHRPVDFVWLEKDNELVKEKFERIQTGDTVVVATGELIPVDGVVLSGSADVNESSMTGEALPVKKSRGDRVLSGTVVTDGKLRLFAEVVGDSTAMLRVSRYVESAMAEKTEAESKTAKFADSMVPVTIGLAGLSYLITGKLASVASVLQADYSCVFRISVPVAIKSSVYSAGVNGILFKDGVALEKLASVNTVVLDKTGTLTHGKLTVEKIILSPDAEITETEFLNLAASIEEHYFHPVAEAIVMAAREKDFTHFRHGDVEFVAGHGVISSAGGHEIMIGSRHFLQDHGNISFDSLSNELSLYESDHVILFIAYDRRPLGVIVLKDTIREEAADTIHRLRDLGISRIVLLSGDRSDRVSEMGKELALDEFHGEMKPEQKAGIIERLKSEGRSIAFVGDGINDAPSLTKADVGISMGNAADITHATSDIILLKDDLRSLVFAREIASNAIDIIHKNYNLSVGANTGIILGAMSGMISPFTTALLHNGSTIGLVLHSFLGGQKKKGSHLD